MADVTNIEGTVAKSIDTVVTKEVPRENLMMRWADGGDPATLYLSKRQAEYTLDARTGIRNAKNPDAPVTPEFTEPMPEGSIIDLGEGQTFLVSPSSNRAIQNQFPESVFVKRIPTEDKVDENGKNIEGFAGLNQRFQAEGKTYMVYSKENGNIPLSKKTVNDLQGTKLQI